MTELLTQAEVCKLFRITRQTIYRWRKEGKITAKKIGNSVMFQQSEMIRVIEESKDPVRLKN